MLQIKDKVRVIEKNQSHRTLFRRDTSKREEYGKVKSQRREWDISHTKKKKRKMKVY